MATIFATGIATHENSFEAGKQAASQAKLQLKDSIPDIIILFCSSSYNYNEVMQGIYSETNQTIPIIGCTSSGQFTDQKITKNGVACAFIASNTHQFYFGIGKHLKNHPMLAIQAAAQNFPRDIDAYPYQSALLFVDGLAGKGEETVLAASSLLGPLVKFAGGAAADSLTFTQTAVFGHYQALSDAVSLCLVASRSPVIISAKHAHHPISPPLMITKARENILYEVEGRPALDVWKDYLRDILKAQGIDVDQLNLKELSKVFLQYEAGLLTGENYKIRFPISCNADGSLNFVCSIMERSVVCIMDSTKEAQISVVQQAAEQALQMARGRPIAGAIIFDCACRTMILKEAFSESIEASQKILGSIPIIGCETYGEIAMELGQLSGFHNASTVIMLFPF